MNSVRSIKVCYRDTVESIRPYSGSMMSGVIGFMRQSAFCMVHVMATASLQGEDASKDPSRPYVVRVPCNVTCCADERLQRPTALDGMSLEEVMAFRRRRVDAHRSLRIYPESYEPLNEIYGGIEPLKKWVGVTPYYIANPYFLLNLSMANHVTPINACCPKVSVEFTEGMVEERRVGQDAVEFFRLVYGEQFMHPGKVRIMMVNAYDAGFRYMTVDPDGSRNVEPISGVKGVYGNVYSRSGFYHCGRYGKNNLSPEDRAAWLSIKENGAATRIVMKLWRGDPRSTQDQADLTYIITVDPTG